MKNLMKKTYDTKYKNNMLILFFYLGYLPLSNSVSFLLLGSK